MKILVDIIKFKDYCNNYYNLDFGMHPIATNEQMDKAIYIFITEVKFMSIEFDTIDRVRVKGILDKMIYDTNVDNLLKTKLG
jgi:predicted DNA-binding protein YlxM (UPF0122 family)